MVYSIALDFFEDLQVNKHHHKVNVYHSLVAIVCPTNINETTQIFWREEIFWWPGEWDIGKNCYNFSFGKEIFSLMSIFLFNYIK